MHRSEEVGEGDRIGVGDGGERVLFRRDLRTRHFEWAYGSSGALDALAKEVASNGPRALDVLDGVLMMSRSLGAYNAADELNLILAASGSAWTVGEQPDGTPCLQRRVESTTEAAARIEFSAESRAARHLSIAWDKVYGRTPDASAAYREAVRGVEAAARPIVTPDDSLATLGKMIRALEDKPSKWSAEIGSIEAFTQMLRQLWTSQLDRHGTDDESVPLSVSPAQAEAAVHLAMTLVHWLRSSTVRRA